MDPWYQQAIAQSRADMDRRGMLAPPDPRTLPGAVQQQFGLLAGLDRPMLLPQPDRAEGGGPDWSNWTAPEWMYEGAKAVALPGHVQRGGEWSPEDVTNMALTVGGSAGAASMAGGVPNGALGMGNVSRPAVELSHSRGLGRTLTAHTPDQITDKPAGTINSIIRGAGSQVSDDSLSAIRKYVPGDPRLGPARSQEELMEIARRANPSDPEGYAALIAKRDADWRERSIPNAASAARFAQEAEAIGLVPKVEWDKGGSAYVTLMKPNYTKSGELHKTKPYVPVQGKSGPFKARFADHAQYYGATVSVDPVSGNTLDDALAGLRWAVGDRSTPAPEIGKADIVPGSGSAGRFRGREPLASSGTPPGILADLPMDEASRMARARDMGFDVDAYKGMHPYDYRTGPVYGFKDGKWQQVERIDAEPDVVSSIDAPSAQTEMGGKYAGFFGDQNTANRFANYFSNPAVFPTKLKFSNPLVIDAKGKPAGAFQFKKMAESAGTIDDYHRFNEVFTGGGPEYDGVIIKNTADEGTVYVPKSPQQVRSRFAAFDPAKADSADLLASSGTPAGLLVPRQEQVPPWMRPEWGGT